MTKVITYGTYDMLHRGHIRLLERARELGDYLIVGVTAEDFDRARGKINVVQSLAERMEAVRSTGLADEVIVEEYEGQKIDDILRYGVDIFTVGSDWTGKFDYLNEYCKVVYLERTDGVSSTEIRENRRLISMGFVGEGPVVEKYLSELRYVNGLTSSGYLQTPFVDSTTKKDYLALLDVSDAVFLATHPDGHFEEIETALDRGVHVLCEAPMVKSCEAYDMLKEKAKTSNLLLVDAVKTAHAVAFERLLLLAKSGAIGRIVSVDSSCSGMSGFDIESHRPETLQGAMDYWGPTAFLPIVALLGSAPTSESYVAFCSRKYSGLDLFVRASFEFDDAIASFKAGRTVKTEGELVVSGTKGYIYVPAPWWKTDYFEVRGESADDTRRYFYQLDGEGIRNQLVSFVQAVESGGLSVSHFHDAARGTSCMLEHFLSGEYTKVLMD